MNIKFENALSANQQPTSFKLVVFFFNTAQLTFMSNEKKIDKESFFYKRFHCKFCMQKSDNCPSIIFLCKIFSFAASNRQHFDSILFLFGFSVLRRLITDND